MDPAARRRLQEAGFSEAEIAEFEASQQATPQAVGTTAPAAGSQDLPEIDLQQPSTASQQPTNFENQGIGLGQMAMGALSAAAPYALPAAGAAAIGYGAFKGTGWARGLGQNIQEINRTMQDRTAFERQREARISQRPGFGNVPRPGAPTAAPQPGPYSQGPQVQPTQPAQPTQARPTTPPRTPPTGAVRPDLIAQEVRNMAMQGARAARGATGLGALMYSGGLNTNEDAELERYRRIARERGLIQ